MAKYNEQVFTLASSIFGWLESAPQLTELLKYVVTLSESEPNVTTSLFEILSEKMLRDKNNFFLVSDLGKEFLTFSEPEQLISLSSVSINNVSMQVPDGSVRAIDSALSLFAKKYVDMWNYAMRFGSAQEVHEQQSLLALITKNCKKEQISYLFAELSEHLKFEGQKFQENQALVRDDFEREINTLEKINAFPSLFISTLMSNEQNEKRHIFFVRILKVLALLKDVTEEEYGNMIFLNEAVWLMQVNELQALTLINFEAKRTAITSYSSPETYRTIRKLFNRNDLISGLTYTKLSQYVSTLNSDQKENLGMFIYSFLKTSFYVNQVLGPFDLFEVIRICSTSESVEYMSFVSQLMDEVVAISDSDKQRLQKLLEVVAYLSRALNLIQYV